MRASTLRDTWQAVRASDDGAALMRTPAAPLFEKIDSMAPMTWLDIEDIVLFYQTIWKTLGAKESYRLTCESMVNTLQQGIFKQLTAGAERLHGLTPSAILEYGPRAYAQVTKNCGSQQILSSTDRSAVMQWSEVPELLIKSEPWRDAMLAKYEAQIIVANCKGTVVVRERSARLIVFALSWS